MSRSNGKKSNEKLMMIQADEWQQKRIRSLLANLAYVECELVTRHVPVIALNSIHVTDRV